MDAGTKKLLDTLRTRLEQEDVFDASEWDLFTKELDVMDEAKGDIQAILDKRLGGKACKFDAAAIEKVVEGYIRRKKLDEAERAFNYDHILVDWLKSVPFFLEISRWIKKRAGATFPKSNTPNPTAAMCYNLETDDFELLYNRRWFASLLLDSGVKDGTKEVEGVTNHEFYHFLFRHICERRRTPPFAWNIATDSAINSIIVGNGGRLPKGGIIPGEKWPVPDRPMTPEEKKMHEGLSALIESWPKMQASEWYFNRLMEWSQENSYEWGRNGIKMPGQGDGEWEIDSIDSHDFWDQIPEEAREIVQQKLREVVKRAVQKADQQQNGWGNIPAELREAIRASVDNQIDWQKALAAFIGTFTRGDRRNSIKKINKKYPYIHPGTKRDYLPHIAIFMDQSGSVCDTWVEQFFSVLRSLAKKVSFTVIPFDYGVDKENMFEWKKGQTPAFVRTRAGGTCFDAPTEFANAPENRGRWDGMIILTDGGAPKPRTSRIKRAWVLAPNCKLAFEETEEMVIQMDEPGKRLAPGAWR